MVRFVCGLGSVFCVYVKYNFGLRARFTQPKEVGRWWEFFRRESVINGCMPWLFVGQMGQWDKLQRFPFETDEMALTHLEIVASCYRSAASHLRARGVL